jgi:hypothetical protein
MPALLELPTARLVSDADHVELSRLVAELVWRIDAGLVSTAYELFAPDGELHIRPVDVVGIEAIKVWGEQLDAANALPGIRNAVTNLRFVDDGDDRAHAPTVHRC